MLERRDISQPAVLAALLLVLGTLCFRGVEFSLQRPQFFLDDAYIYLRYLSNTARGCVLTYNCGTPPVEGFTSPAFFALLLLGRLISANEVALLQIISCGLLLTALSAASLLCFHPALTNKRTGLGLAMCGLVALSFAVEPYVLVHGILGLETPLAALIPVLLFAAALRSNPSLLVWASGCAVLVRPEYGVYLPLIWLFPAARCRVYWLPLCGGLLLLELLRLVIFGDFLPNTYWAKSGGSAVHFQAGLAYMWTGIKDFPIVVFSPLIYLRRDLRRPALFSLLGIASVALFQLRTGGDFFRFSRLVFHFVPIATVFAAFGCVELVERLQKRSGFSDRLALACAVAPLLILSGWNSARHEVTMQRPPNSVNWEALGRWFAPMTQDTKIAVTMIGAVGYFSDKPIVDLVGLVHPEIAKKNRDAPIASAKEIAHERHNILYVLSQRPTYVVLMQHQDHPWSARDRLSVANPAEREFVDSVNNGIAPYALYVPEIVPGTYWVMFRRKE